MLSYFNKKIPLLKLDSIYNFPPLISFCVDGGFVWNNFPWNVSGLLAGFLFSISYSLNCNGINSSFQIELKPYYYMV